jgi:hypothetical protein
MSVCDGYFLKHPTKTYLEWTGECSPVDD